MAQGRGYGDAVDAYRTYDRSRDRNEGEREGMARIVSQIAGDQTDARMAISSGGSEA
jgi:hypothetical protein